ncbi:MAG: hypothetical protein O2923_10315 [Verrucomicrobia bacterium]|nr:hypothetical protein [Verrucomicrobiota bacterium]MDA1087494.1 hypothetical protein [Verrucomicrobiota bacterium]
MKQVVDRAFKPVAEWIHGKKMEKFGIRNTMQMAKAYNYMPEALSQSASRKLNYWSRGKGYRVSDEELYSVVDPGERRELTLPKGTVLFIDTSRCFHYGSRYARIARYQMMYGLVSPCRCDFSESFMDTISYTIHESDSRLRKMVLDKCCTA